MSNFEAGRAAGGGGWNPLKRFASALGRFTPDSFSRPPTEPLTDSPSEPGLDSPLPAAPPDPQPAPAVASAPAYKPIVLVIEHLAEDARNIAMQLAQAGLYPPIASTAGEGIALALRIQPNLILINQALPDLSGFRAVQKLASDAATSQLPVILVGRSDDPGTRAYAVRAGAVGVLSKEDELSAALIPAVQRFLRRQPNRDQRAAAELLDAAKLEAIARLAAELSADPYLNDRGRAAVVAAEVEATFGLRAVGGGFADFEGNLLDDDHTWLNGGGGWIVDPSIGRFRQAVLGWPGYGDVAVIPPSSPLAACYLASE